MSTLTAQRQAQGVRQQFFDELPQSVRLNTELSERLKSHYLTNSPKQVAMTLVSCIQGRVWEAVAYMAGAERHQEVRQYTPLQWMRECIGVEPDELMRTVAGDLADPEEAASAAKTLTELVKAEEPQTFRRYLADVELPKGIKLPGWRRLLQEKAKIPGGPWVEAQAALDRDAKGEAGDNQHTGSGGPPLPKGITKAEHGTRDNIRRRLERYAADPAACAERGVKPEQVDRALTLFLRGQLSAAAAEREAGLAKPRNQAARLRMGGTVNDIAMRLIEAMGRDKAAELATVLASLLAEP
jgi:hypothetical protein